MKKTATMLRHYYAPRQITIIIEENFLEDLKADVEILIFRFLLRGEGRRLRFGLFFLFFLSFYAFELDTNIITPTLTQARDPPPPTLVHYYSTP